MDDSALRSTIVSRLREITDPELGINIIDLGLIFGIDINDRIVHVKFSVTTPGCPIRRFIQKQIEDQLDAISEIESYEVTLVLQPAWTVEMALPEALFFLNPEPNIFGNNG